ncbi:MBL fold metallo-hydrolase [Bacillus aquiflavi]|uniref:MBL fold metallo-hydrolase n=1 Tax=Bacillus aquiflavi TaxID=2672567 RepID=A0A6B3VUR3_9BACI|nr:MBL fold metallo-hydrolase [Bacillus aquiflavi]MBA4535691.1 MBL fold metallo-hydrolase [Bacillus aquiflavi]NEY80067.1 MBL fold metallo-hydrolase [Bacillus aquiflavi]
MKFTVIGCWGGYPKANEASAGYLLEHDGFHLLIDCGSAVLSKLQSILPPENLDCVIISHYHPDHVADIGVLQHARLIQRLLGKDSPILPIYGHGQDEQEFAKLTYKDITVGIEYDPDETLAIGPFSITFLQTKHPVDCYGMRIEAGEKSIIYTADTAYNEEFVHFSKNADLLVCECNFYGNQNGQEAGHMTSIEAGRLAEKANVTKLLLTHLPHYGNLNHLVTEAGQAFKGTILLAKSKLSIHF